MRGRRSCMRILRRACGNMVFRRSLFCPMWRILCAIKEYRPLHRSDRQLLEYSSAIQPLCPVSFLTAHADFGYAQTALTLGSFDYILQPARYEEIENSILRAKGQRAPSATSLPAVLPEYWNRNRRSGRSSMGCPSTAEYEKASDPHIHPSP